MILSSSRLIVFLLVSATASISAQNVTGFDVEILETRLPKALSDFTTVADSDAGKVYLAGGCDSPNGNEFNSQIGQFACGSVTDASFAFDLKTKVFTETATLPVARYRHAAVLVNNQVWMVGGRDVNDSLIPTVDRYDIANDTWTAYDDLDIKYHVSDLAGFVGPNGLAYFVGGYNLTYAAQSTVFTINPVKSTETGVLEVAECASLPTARGDLSAVVAVDQSGNDYALATGGFTNENNFCEPLAVAERYNFTSDTWSEAAELKTAVGDQALVVLNNRIFALAGERQIANICLVSPDDPPDPGEETVPIDDVEWYDAASSTWTLIEDLPHHRFRFAAIGYHDKIYSFGGQLAYANSCQCFKTSDEVIVYTLSYEAINKTTSTSGAAVTSKLAALLLAFVGALFI